LAARFVDVLDDDVVAALAVRVVLPLTAPLALAFAVVLVEEAAFFLVVALAGAFFTAGAFFVAAAFLAGAAFVTGLVAADLVAGFVDFVLGLAADFVVDVVFALVACFAAAAGFAFGLEAVRGAFLVAEALVVVAFFVATEGFLVVAVAFFATGAWFSLVSAAFLEASFTFPEGPLGREKTLVSAPRAMARLMFVICEGVMSILYCSSRNFLIIGRETPARASSG